MLLSKVSPTKLKKEKDGDEFIYNENTDILVISDMHIDFKSKRPIYFRECLAYLDKLIYKLSTLVNPTVIFLGDLFHKDLNNQKGILYFEEVIQRFNKIEGITEGRCFLVLGNHENTYHKISPTFLLTEVSPTLEQTLNDNGVDFKRTGGSILKTPHTIRIKDTKISLFHFRKDGSYKAFKGDALYHIGLYHDTYVSHQMYDVIGNNLPIGKIWGKHMKDANFNFLDLAIFGDFHIPLPVFKLANARNTICVVPGSFGRNNISVEVYDTVKLPIISIRGNKTTVNIENFPLIPYQKSYNMVDKNKDVSGITNRIKSLMRRKGTSQGSKSQTINLNNYLNYIIEVYGEEYYNRVRKIVRGGIDCE